MKTLVVILVLLALVLAWLAYQRRRPDPFGEKFPNPTKPRPEPLADFLEGKVPPPEPSNPLPPERPLPRRREKT